MAHKDKLRTPPTKKYKANHDKIFGKPTFNQDATPEELARQEESRKHTHAKEAEDGKKPADWYAQNERRIPSNPDYVPGHTATKAYVRNYAAIFGRKK